MPGIASTGRRISDGDGVAYFIDGIGPPLQQIADDHRRRPTDHSSLDILALIAHVDDLLAEKEVLLEATRSLIEIHEYECGCDRPGNPMACVCEPVDEFRALEPWLGRDASLPLPSFRGRA